MNKSIKSGLSFGLTSGIITTIGLIIGLGIGTNSKTVVIAGILTIAFVDALSDAFGIHMEKESEHKNSKDIWRASIATLVSKIILALTFLVPVWFLDLNNALIASIIWSGVLLIVLSYIIAKSNKEKILKVVGEHLGIAAIVIVLTYFIGEIISLIL